MGLSWQQGPLSTGVIGRFLVPEPLPERLLYVEPLRRRVRVRFGGTWTVDSEQVVLLFKPGRYPVACFPEPTPHTRRWTMKAIVVTDRAARTAGMKLVDRPEPQAAINDVVVQVHASGFIWDEQTWPSTWTDRLDRDRTPSIPGHELAGVVTALGYGTTGLSVGQRVFGLADWYRDGTLAEYVAMEARNLAPLPGDVDFTVGASLPISGLTAWQGLFQHGRLQAEQSVLVHGAAGAVGSMVTQLARESGAYVIGTGRAAHRQPALDFGAQEFVDLENDALEDVGGVRSRFRCLRRRHREAVRRPDSSRRNVGDHHRPNRGTARQRSDGRLRCRGRSCPTE